MDHNAFPHSYQACKSTGYRTLESKYAYCNHFINRVPARILTEPNRKTAVCQSVSSVLVEINDHRSAFVLPITRVCRPNLFCSCVGIEVLMHDLMELILHVHIRIVPDLLLDRKSYSSNEIFKLI